MKRIPFFWIRPFALAIGVAFLGLAISTVWFGRERRDMVCRVGITDIMNLNSGNGHVDPDSAGNWVGYPNVDLLIVSADGAAVHDARCGFSFVSLFQREPVLDSVSIDDIDVSPIRIKLLGIALGVATDPAPPDQ